MISGWSFSPHSLPIRQAIIKVNFASSAPSIPSALANTPRCTRTAPLPCDFSFAREMRVSIPSRSRLLIKTARKFSQMAGRKLNSPWGNLPRSLFFGAKTLFSILRDYVCLRQGSTLWIFSTMGKLFPEFRCRESNCNQPHRARQRKTSHRLDGESFPQQLRWIDDTAAVEWIETSFSRVVRATTKMFNQILLSLNGGFPSKLAVLRQHESDHSR